MLTINFGWRWCVAAVLWAGLSMVQAADTVVLTLQMNSGQISGKLQGNSRLGQGQVVYDGEHVGFQVWSDVVSPGSQPNSYVLTGKGNGNNTLRVRIEKAGWVVDKESGKGIILHTRERSASFDVVVDGDQTVKPDHYTLSLKGAILTP